MFHRYYIFSSSKVFNLLVIFGTSFNENEIFNNMFPHNGHRRHPPSIQRNSCFFVIAEKKSLYNSHKNSVENFVNLLSKFSLAYQYKA